MHFRHSVYIISFLFCLGRPCFADDDFLQQSILSDLADDSLLLDITRTSNRTIAVGERGHILISNGSTWKQVISPVQVTLTSVFFINDSVGWVTGHDAAIMKTTDAGEHWELVYSDREADAPLLDIWFEDSLHGYAIGAYGYFMETHDGGEHWQKRYIGEDDFHLNQLRATEDGCLFIAAEAGFAYRSVNEGKEWGLLETPYQGSFYSVLPLDCQHLWLAGLRGHLYYSDDGGKNWLQHELPTESMLTNMLLTEDHRILITGLNGTVLLKNESSVLQYISEYRDDFLAIERHSDDQFVLVGSRGIQYLDIQDFR